MAASEEEDFGGFDDDDLILLVESEGRLQRPNNSLPRTSDYHHPRKRRKLDTYKFRSERIQQINASAQSRELSAFASESAEQSDDAIELSFGKTSHRKAPPNAPITPTKLPKSKHRIHVPKNPDLSRDTIYTRVPPSSVSPHRLAGAKLQKPKPSTPSCTTKASIQAPLVVHRDGINANTTSDEDVALGFSPVRVRTSKDPAIYVENLALQRQHLVGPQANLRQTTLFGGDAPGLDQQTQSIRRHNWPLAHREELMTHHKLSPDALSTWVYPTNLGAIRDYQYNIVARGLYHNLLVALPTGLGKTFIAATIMLNWFRWTKDAQIVFVAPTKPLVAQQVDACFNIVGIPRSATTMLTGQTAPGLRSEEWNSKRVFFMTPQTIINDLKSGICDPKRIVLLVVDEAHRATGGYAYVEVVKFLRRFNTSFRVLALTATPGSSVEAVQEVIDGLGIARVEIRTEESLDIRHYVHSRKTETVLFDYSQEMEMAMGLFAEALRPTLNKLVGLNAYWMKDPMMLTPYGCTQARAQWMSSDAGKKASYGVKGMVNTIFSLLASLSHATILLKFHGISPFFHKLLDFRNSASTGEKGSKYQKQILESEPFKKLMARIQGWVSKIDFVGHPKLEYLQNVVLNHFLDAGEGRGAAAGAPPSSTRIMVFAHYRDSAEDIARVLTKNEPIIRPHVFVGQASSKGSEGMDQKKQLEIIEKFKTGIYNTLVATSIGEEGLDIGEVDLIVCYDASASPIRMLQRMGRTGRKRAGNIVVTLMKGKEEHDFEKAKDNYEKMQRMIAAGTRFNFHDDTSPRIMPMNIIPIVDKKIIEIPFENTQAGLPEPKKRDRAPKKPPKKFHMPDGVSTGFRNASRIDERASENSGNELSQIPEQGRQSSPALQDLPSVSEVLLTATEEKDFERTYLDVGGDTPQIVEMPAVNKHPAMQRSLGWTKHCRHGRVTKGFVGMLDFMHGLDERTSKCFAQNLHPDDRLSGQAQAQNRMNMMSRSLPSVRSSPNSRTVTPDKEHNPLKSIFLATGKSRQNSSQTGNFVAFDSNEESQGSLDEVFDAETVAVASSASSPPALDFSAPFYLSQKSSYGAKSDSDSADDLPDVSAFVHKEGSKDVLASANSISNGLGRRTSCRKGRNVLTDESDE